MRRRLSQDFHIATIASEIASNERPTFRREYQRAWQEVAQTGAELPVDLILVITRYGQTENLTGDTESPPAVVVGRDSHRFEARILSAAGRPVLEVGEASPEQITRVLEATRAFLPLRLDGIGVKLLVDGTPFMVSSEDPLLTDLGLEWLPEVLVIGHELRSEQIEKGVLPTTVDRRARSIRVRRCKELSLVVEGAKVSPPEQMSHYAFEHEDLPTLILPEQFSLNWASLARTLAPSIARLVDSRVRTPVNLLLNLALDYQGQDLTAPSHEALARALDCDVLTIQEHRASLRTDLSRVLHLLVPVVACLRGPATARQLLADADRSGVKFDARDWLLKNISGQTRSPDELLRACEKAGDRANILALEIGPQLGELSNYRREILAEELAQWMLCRKQFPI